MQVHILASGSTGNAIFLQFGSTRLLVDAGISARRIEKALAELGVRAADLDGILITHEHQDHVKGLDVLARRHQIPVYAREKAWQQIDRHPNFPLDCCRAFTGGFDLGMVRVEPFAIPHDAADPVGFAFLYGKTRCVVATDLGMVTPEVENALHNTQVLILESNHDLDMLHRGPYPPYLKQRIRSNKGHLSNHDAGKALSRLRRQQPMQVFLAHLSQQNNHPRLAEQTVTRFLKQGGCQVGEEVILHPTFPDRTSSLIYR